MGHRRLRRWYWHAGSPGHRRTTTPLQTVPSQAQPGPRRAPDATAVRILGPLDRRRDQPADRDQSVRDDRTKGYISFTGSTPMTARPEAMTLATPRTRARRARVNTGSVPTIKRNVASSLPLFHSM